MSLHRTDRGAMRAVVFVVVFLGAAIRPSPAAADPVSYKEQISGDLPIGRPPLPELHLGLGLNTVSGQIGASGDGEVDFDSFAFTVPLASQLVGVQYAFTSAVYDGNAAAGGTFHLKPGNGFRKYHSQSDSGQRGAKGVASETNRSISVVST